jgi:excisionase family DNA binding protein
MPSTSLATAPLPPRLLTTTEAAQFLKCGRNTLEQWRLEGSPVPYVRLGRSVRYDLTDWRAAGSQSRAGSPEYVRPTPSEKVPA